MPAFSTLPLAPSLLVTLGELGYQTMTPIQAESLPAILNGRDVIAQAKTGSGKTAAFGLGLLHHLEVKRFCVQSLVLCPTRELADQVANEIRRLGRGTHNIKVLTLCGGQPFGPQLGSLQHGAHIVVGTPGRLLEHLQKGSLDLSATDYFVLDEADRMLDMGFQSAMDEIVEYLPSKRQTVLFSATYPKEIEQIAGRVLQDPVRIVIASEPVNNLIQQRFFLLDDESQRITATELLLLEQAPESAIVFANTKRETQAVCDQLNAAGFYAAALHGDMEQKERDETLVRFANKSLTVLVATDVAARGLDIEAVDLVINYHLARDSEVHVHRVGRTGRAGSSGLACSLVNKNEQFKLDRLEDQLSEQPTLSPLPQQQLLSTTPPRPKWQTLQIDGGKKDKLRPGDIVGGLTGEQGIGGDQLGKIHITPNKAFVAVYRAVAKQALAKITQGKLKGRNFRARLLR
ncbi:ATP-dependent RNA helicase DbpA [Halioxenophilus sp. WMMB6]|uniref:ATP-dependent RNA helicase DbpA n=1 Tax=Halioxenophilus sp. WMMB6 TaxID=3073815 RepID=UPI00295EFBA0|nr:ATP-dependent RNA helicase DbpA [Halioxenophilus sp. WMMB6]